MVPIFIDYFLLFVTFSFLIFLLVVFDKTANMECKIPRKYFYKTFLRINEKKHKTRLKLLKKIM